MVLCARAVGRAFRQSGLRQSGQHGAFGRLPFPVGNAPCRVSGAVEASSPDMELPSFPVLECCRIGLLRRVAMAGLLRVFQLAAKARLTSCPQLLLLIIDLSSAMGWDVNQSTEETSVF